jgi:hypothetical protein
MLLALLLQAPVFAEKVPSSSEATPQDNAAETQQTAPKTEKKQQPSVLLVYQIQDGSVLSFDLANDPLTAVLTVLQQSALAAKQKQTPVETSANLKGTKQLKPLLEHVPPIELTTHITENKGQTVFTHAKFKHSQTENGETGTVVWEGLQGTLDFKGDLQEPHIKVQAPGLDFTLESETDPASFSMRELALELSLDADQEPSLLDLQLPSANMTADQSKISLTGLQMHVVSTESLPGLKLFNAQLSLADMSINDNKRNPPVSISLKNLKTDAKSNLENDSINYNLVIDAEKLAVPPSMIEGENNTLSYHSSLSVQRLDAKALTELQKAIRTMKEQNMPQEMMGLALMGKLMELLPALISKSPQINLSKFNLIANTGRIEGQLKLTIHGDKPLNFGNPAALLQSVEGAADFRVSKTLLEESLRAKYRQKYPEQADNEEKRQQFISQGFAKIEQQGFLVAEGDDYKLSAHIKDGKAQLNGKPMPLPGMPRAGGQTQ